MLYYNLTSVEYTFIIRTCSSIIRVVQNIIQVVFEEPATHIIKNFIFGVCSERRQSN